MQDALACREPRTAKGSGQLAVANSILWSGVSCTFLETAFRDLVSGALLPRTAEPRRFRPGQAARGEGRRRAEARRQRLFPVTDAQYFERRQHFIECRGFWSPILASSKENWHDCKIGPFGALTCSKSSRQWAACSLQKEIRKCPYGYRIPAQQPLSLSSSEALFAPLKLRVLDLSSLNDMCEGLGSTLCV